MDEEGKGLLLGHFVNVFGIPRCHIWMSSPTSAPMRAGKFSWEKQAGCWCPLSSNSYHVLWAQRLLTKLGHALGRSRFKDAWSHSTLGFEHSSTASWLVASLEHLAFAQFCCCWQVKMCTETQACSGAGEIHWERASESLFFFFFFPESFEVKM